MIISSIVAMGKNRVIGRDNQMMWHIPSEYLHYQKMISGHHYVIGRKNYMGSLKKHENKKALVLSRNDSLSFHHPVFNEIREAINFARDQGEEELFIIGGEEIYRLCMPLIDRLYLSVVDVEEKGDAYFPDHEGFHWITKEEIDYSQNNKCTPISWSFFRLEKART